MVFYHAIDIIYSLEMSFVLILLRLLVIIDCLVNLLFVLIYFLSLLHNLLGVSINKLLIFL